MLFYFGDELGYMKLWDLTYILQLYGGPKMTKTHIEVKGKNFFPYRIEGIEISYVVAKSVYK